MQTVTLSDIRRLYMNGLSARTTVNLITDLACGFSTADAYVLIEAWLGEHGFDICIS